MGRYHIHHPWNKAIVVDVGVLLLTLYSGLQCVIAAIPVSHFAINQPDFVKLVPTQPVSSGDIVV